MTVSILEFCEYQEEGHCGYCKQEAKESSGVWAHKFTPSAYLNFMNCGWRRSGSYVYKPNMAQTCCPQYTIRLDSGKFYLTKSQKKVLKRMNDFLKSDVRPKEGRIREEASVQAVLSEEKESKHKTEKRTKPSGDIRKKKEIRKERCYKKWTEKGLDISEMKSKRVQKEESRRSTLKSLIDCAEDSWKHRLEVVLVKPKASLELLRRQECFQLFKKYQETIHKDTDNTIASYERFLIQTPLVDDLTVPVDEKKPAYGSYHQWYILDNKIIAVGVVDILPHCLSSKYVYYDPDYLFLNLGTYTALREIYYTQLLSETRAELKYYYMGYYIHSCPKMRYKGKYHPSELLCDNSFKWFPLTECVRKIAANDGKFVNFDDNTAQRLDTNDLLVYIQGSLIRYGNLEPLITRRGVGDTTDIRQTLDRIAKLLSPECQEVAFYVSKIVELFE
ncbi:unnamed protein product [Auanema sp. JU1783]|nr:unnamed protein product [Auanema sp. JU1783]